MVTVIYKCHKFHLFGKHLLGNYLVGDSACFHDNCEKDYGNIQCMTHWIVSVYTTLQVCWLDGKRGNWITLRTLKPPTLETFLTLFNLSKSLFPYLAMEEITLYWNLSSSDSSMRPFLLFTEEHGLIFKRNPQKEIVTTLYCFLSM